MKVKELLSVLNHIDPELDIMMYYDGDARLKLDSMFIRFNHEFYDNETGAVTEKDVLVFCQKDDVYGFNKNKKESWFWRKE